MKYDDWKLITEAFGGPMNLGMKKPNVVGGPVGSKFDDMENNDEMHGDEEDMDDEEEIENDEDMDDEEDMDDYGDDEDMDDEEDDDYDYGDEEEEDEIHPNRSDNKKMMKKDPNMDFLNDIDPNFMNDDKGDDYYHSDDEDHEDHEHDHEDHEDGETCPECDGSDPDCEMCHGEEGHEGHGEHGHSEDDYGDEPQKQISYDGGQDQDTAELISKMSSWMSKYMKKESVETEQAPLLNEKKSCNKCGKMMKKMMSKDKEYCNCESTDWIKQHKDLEKRQADQNKKPSGSDWIKQHKDLEKRQADQNKKPSGHDWIKSHQKLEKKQANENEFQNYEDANFLNSLISQTSGTEYKPGEAGFSPYTRIGEAKEHKAAKKLVGKQKDLDADHDGDIDADDLKNLRSKKSKGKKESDKESKQPEWLKNIKKGKSEKSTKEEVPAKGKKESDKESKQPEWLKNIKKGKAEKSTKDKKETGKQPEWLKKAKKKNESVQRFFPTINEWVVNREALRNS
jgi:hypothetical protein